MSELDRSQLWLSNASAASLASLVRRLCSSMKLYRAVHTCIIIHITTISAYQHQHAIVNIRPYSWKQETDQIQTEKNESRCSFGRVHYLWNPATPKGSRVYSNSISSEQPLESIEKEVSSVWKVWYFSTASRWRTVDHHVKYTKSRVKNLFRIDNSNGKSAIFP